MLILLTNDDGIRAEGLQQLRRGLEEIAEVVVVAPEQERSATGHGITMHKPLRVKQVYVAEAYYGSSVSGTPADCVKLALDILLEKKPDLVISGINNGLNLGTDILYSGTVSAALEAVINGVPAYAVSTEEDATPEDLSYAASFIKHLVLQHTLPSNSLINVNIPRRSLGPIKGVKTTKQGFKRYENSTELRKDPRGKDYYWLGGKIISTGNDPGSDMAAIAERYVSLTPIQYDLTNYQVLSLLDKWQISATLE